jgi:hypothetical protein
VLPLLSITTGELSEGGYNTAAALSKSCSISALLLCFIVLSLWSARQITLKFHVLNTPVTKRLGRKLITWIVLTNVLALGGILNSANESMKILASDKAILYEIPPCSASEAGKFAYSAKYLHTATALVIAVIQWKRPEKVRGSMAASTSLGTTHQSSSKSSSMPFPVANLSASSLVNNKALTQLSSNKTSV